MKHSIFCCLAGCLLLMAGGCRSSRSTLNESHVVRLDSLRRVRTDSLQGSFMRSLQNQTHIQLRQITFLPPDSSARQYVETVTVLDVLSEKKRDEKEVSTQLTTEMIQQAHREEVQTQTEIATKRSFPLRMVVYGVIGVLLLGVVVRVCF
ncbi:MAG: hypothetical protein LIP01_01785 [Tannerellaceae bacterium]|nr:hypothetical protein [Tannerellaceae bacterium]